MVAQDTYPHLTNLPLAEKLAARTIVLQYLRVKAEMANNTAIKASAETWITKQHTAVKARADYEAAQKGAGWMKYHAKATK